MANTKSKLKGTLKRNEDAKPFTSLDDERIEFLRKFLIWLERWQKIHSVYQCGFLTRETFTALQQNVKVLIAFIEKSLTIPGVEYVLLGKLQTDNLEHRFGCYRQLSGGNYNISAAQVFESEKKIRVKSLLGITSARYGAIKFDPALLQRNDKKGEDDEDDEFESSLDDSVINEFLPVLDYPVEFELNEGGFIFVSGYTAFKLKHKLSCVNCIDYVTGESTDNSYFNDLNRGGLCVPSDLTVQIGIHVYTVMQALISKDYEIQFLRQSKQKAILKHFSLMSISRDSLLHFLNFDACLCGKPFEKLLNSIVCTMCNILLNNYSKELKNEIAVSKEGGGKKRKLDTLS